MKNFTETVHYQEMLDAITRHFKHAVEKHPYFCDGLLPTQVSKDWSDGEVRDTIVNNLRLARERLEASEKLGNRLWNEVLNCEVWEISEALFNGNTAEAIEECCDSIVVLMRVICVLKGYQQLGNPEVTK